MDTSRLKRLANEIREKAELEKSIETARKRQVYMLPDVPKIDGFEFNSLYLPCANVSGDFYDFIRVSEHEIGIALGDVSGHGVEAGIIMGMAKKALQIYARGLSSPKEALSVTNADLGKDLDGQTFVSAGYGIIDVRARTLKFARAGNNPPYLVNPKREQRITEIKPNGMVIGVDKTGKAFPAVTKEETIQLQSGDVFFQYTDGLVEAPNREKKEFGDKRLQELLLNNISRPLDEIIAVIEDAVQGHIAPQEQEDDITMIAVRVL